MVASLIFIVLLRFLAGIMVWVMIVMVILVLGYGEQGLGASPWLSPFPSPCFQWDLPCRSSRAASPAGIRAERTIFCFLPQESSTVTWNTQS